MSNEEIKATADQAAPHVATDRAVPPHRRRSSRLALTGVASVALLALGIAGGAGAMKLAKPSVEMAPMAPVAISTLPDGDLVTIKGKVAEIFGNKFVLQDASGRALVETGPTGEDGKLVTVNEEISVQGRFDDGFLHASFLVHPDGRIEALGPAGKPPHHGHGPRPGPDGGPKDGPKGGPDARSDADPGPAAGPVADAGPRVKGDPAPEIAPAPAMGAGTGAGVPAAGEEAPRPPQP
ncbi:hypothetical protein GA0004734_00037410 [Rhizobium sp. 9140]|nr:hypothetical protein GA0004734_00037410 [Rhizobium sp. 9140]